MKTFDAVHVEDLLTVGGEDVMARLEAVEARVDALGVPGEPVQLAAVEGLAENPALAETEALRARCGELETRLQALEAAQRAAAKPKKEPKADNAAKPEPTPEPKAEPTPEQSPDAGQGGGGETTESPAADQTTADAG